jgi:hypothetical protein
VEIEVISVETHHQEVVYEGSQEDIVNFLKEKVKFIFITLKHLSIYPGLYNYYDVFLYLCINYCSDLQIAKIFYWLTTSKVFQCCEASQFLSEVGIANFFGGLLIANLLIFF